MKYLRAAPFHSHKIYRTIQKEKDEDPSTSASQQEASQSGNLNTYVLLHSVPTRFTARLKKKEADPATSASQQDATQPGKLNTYLLLHSICTIFTAWLKNKKKGSITSASQQEASQSGKLNTVPPAPFHSRNIHRMMQNQKQEDQFASASQQEASQSGKSNTYVLLHSIPAIFNAWSKNKKESVIHPRQHHSEKRVNQANQILTTCSIPFP